MQTYVIKGFYVVVKKDITWIYIYDWRAFPSITRKQITDSKRFTTFHNNTTNSFSYVYVCVHFESNKNVTGKNESSITLLYSDLLYKCTFKRNYFFLLFSVVLVKVYCIYYVCFCLKETCKEFNHEFKKSLNALFVLNFESRNLEVGKFRPC